MPPVRTTKARRVGEDSFQLTWTAPAEPAEAPTISFAPNVTPVTFADPPPFEGLVDVSSSNKPLFPPAPPLSASSSCTSLASLATTECDDLPPLTDRKETHAKKKPTDHIPRPPNAFILFRSSFIKSQHVSSNIEGNHGTLSKIVGMLWHNLPYEERQAWQAEAKKVFAEHKKKFPEYSFKPAATKDEKKGSGTGKGGKGARGGSIPPGKSVQPKRKVREVGPRDVKRCEKIAALLAQGLKGTELEEAIAEFDRTRSPLQIEARFEAPLTARQYRRSSSAPLVDTELAKERARFAPTQSYDAAAHSEADTEAHPAKPKASTKHSQIRANRKRSASSSPPLRAALPLYQPQPNYPAQSLLSFPTPPSRRTSLAHQPTLLLDIPSGTPGTSYYECSPEFETQPSTPALLSSQSSFSASSEQSPISPYSPDAPAFHEFSNFSFSNASTPPSTEQSFSPLDREPSSSHPSLSSVDLLFGQGAYDAPSPISPDVPLTYGNINSWSTCQSPAAGAPEFDYDRQGQVAIQHADAMQGFEYNELSYVPPHQQTMETPMSHPSYSSALALDVYAKQPQPVAQTQYMNQTMPQADVMPFQQYNAMPYMGNQSPVDASSFGALPPTTPAPQMQFNNHFAYPQMDQSAMQSQFSDFVGAMAS